MKWRIIRQAGNLKVFFLSLRRIRFQFWRERISKRQSGSWNISWSILIHILQFRPLLSIYFLKPSNLDTDSCKLPKFMQERQILCMVMRINLDCNGCCRKLRRILLNMKEIEAHLIEKQQCRVSVCGRFRPSDVAIKIRKKMNRRVEILEIQEHNESNEPADQKPTNEQADQKPTNVICGCWLPCLCYFLLLPSLSRAFFFFLFCF